MLLPSGNPIRITGAAAPEVLTTIVLHPSGVSAIRGGGRFCSFYHLLHVSNFLASSAHLLVLLVIGLLTTHHSSLTIHHSSSTSILTTHYSPFTIHRSLFTIHR